MDYENEIWKSIEGYPKYEVSNYGRIACLSYKNTGKRGIKVQSKGKHGYMMVCLHCNGTQKSLRVHRIVCMAFIPNPNNYPSINHKDEDKTNNCVDNLEWCTCQYNSTYNNLHIRRGLAHRGLNSAQYGVPRPDWVRKKIADTLRGRKKPKEIGAKIRAAKTKGYIVRQYDLEGNMLGEYCSSTEASEKTGIYARNIRSCFNGKLKTAGGYRWERVKVNEKS